ncbi:MAG: pol4 [Chthoniobacteraceae bacterium]|nr:pol4 [Chthoniobacteraceae bacterium]
MPTITKNEIAELFEAIALLLELKGENVFKIRAYTNAARALETFTGDLAKAVAENQLGEIPGIGKAIAEKITELLATGELAYYNKLKVDFPAGLFEMFDLQGLGPKKIKAVWEKLGVTSVPELEAACKDGRVAELPGFGKKTADNILAAIEARSKYAGRFRIGDIAPDAEALLEELRTHPDVLQASIAGSYRRRKEIVGDLDFIVATNAPEEVSNFFIKHEQVESIIVNGATKSSVRLKSGIQADLRVVKTSEFPFALNYFTGSKEHNIVLRSRALARGWTLNEYRLEQLSKLEGRKSKGGAPQPIPDVYEERDLYRALELDYIEPELREDRGEIAAAEKHELPQLLQVENLRGTFHNHTTASDGKCTLAEMADAAQELGLQYLGIADHSKASFQAHGLEADRLLAQVAEIRELNKTFGGHFRIFAGVECDVLKDGSLDFPDEVLAQLDYVVASVHASFTMPEAEMTSRIIRAISNPYVTMLGHLTGRILLSRESYQVNVPAIIDAAAATGTIIELNASPWRLDMDWRWWPLAKEKGVRCAINPDAHHSSQLNNLWFGVGIARKGWLTRNDVVNCLPLGQIEAELARKRTALRPS